MAPCPLEVLEEVLGGLVMFHAVVRHEFGQLADGIGYVWLGAIGKVHTLSYQGAEWELCHCFALLGV